MKKLRIGMVGAGNIAKTHLKAYQGVPEAEIVRQLRLTKASELVYGAAVAVAPVAE